MKLSNRIAAGVAVALGLGFAVAVANAHPGQMGYGMGPCAAGEMQQGMGPGMMGGGMGQGNMGGMRHGMGSGRMGGNGIAQQLMTPDEMVAFREQMRAATTPEERQQIAQANRAEMQKRAQEKGITLPQGRGPGARAPAAVPAPAK